MKPLTLTLFVLLLSPGPLALPQARNNYPVPPEPADKSVNAPEARPSTMKRQLDRAKIENEARELLDLSQSLQPDIQSINRGMIPKDTIAKLKRIEKTSKHLRSELEF